MNQSRYRGALLGLACGDAVGATVEFKPRGTFGVLTDMIGGGQFRLQPGEWTDDTSMALCLASSLLACDGFDAADQMDRYLCWKETGYLSSNGRCFDVGLQVLTALGNYRATGNPFSGSTAPDSAGNGCIMRLAPVPMFFFGESDQALHFSVESARTTHAASECLDACRLFAAMLLPALAGRSKEDILFAGLGLQFEEARVIELATGNYRNKDVDEIKSSGYVIHSLEAALWCFDRTSNFRSAILAAVNLGNDADTVAAICGQLAGAYYGVEGIPAAWLERLSMREHIEQLADGLLRAAVNTRSDTSPA